MTNLENASNGDKLTIAGILENVNLSKTSTGSDFYSFIFKDENKSISSRIWDVKEEYKDIVKNGNLVVVTGEVSEYKGQNQLIVTDIRNVTESDNIDETKFFRSAPMQLDKIKRRINQYVDAIKNKKIKKIIVHLLRKNEEAFYTYPAATKNHHAYISGLSHHVLSMLDLAKVISGLYKFLDSDLLYAGVILHDLGKVLELSDYKAPEYTVCGKLIGHITIAAVEVEQVARELNIEGEEVMLLQHLILSHHGKGEWGSPKPPMIAEAEVLHFIDMIDARLNTLEDSLETVDDGEFTKRIFAMENRAFYKPNIK